MSPQSEPVQVVLDQLRALRKRAGIKPETVDERLGIGPGWTQLLETGSIPVSLDFLLAVASTLRISPPLLLQGVDVDSAESSTLLSRALLARQGPDGLVLEFPYGDFDAAYTLPGATLEQFMLVLRELQRGLTRAASEEAHTVSSALQTEAVANAYLRAVRIWPHANPSDLWWFLVYRAYCDPLNHPASHARRDLSQSWKRTAGWALEQVLVRHYGPVLKEYGINLVIGRNQSLVDQLQSRVSDRLEADKVDVFLTYRAGAKEVCFGVVHVKASFAERRTDDVPMSRALVAAGYCSPLWTMDSKSAPGATPVNRGELGEPLGDRDIRSAKRKDIEDAGYFSACFSYNANTIPTPPSQNARSRIYVCNFTNADDQFSRFIRSELQRFLKT